MRKVLVCEDDEDIRLLVSAVVADLADDVVAVGTVAEALRAIGSTDYELVITDLGLPDGTGATVCAAAVDAGSTVVVITATVEASAASVAGAATVLHKPFTPAQLRSAARP